MSVRADIYEWIPRQEWPKAICPHLRRLLKAWEGQFGLRVVEVGLDNPKTPDTVVFLSSPIPFDAWQKATGDSKKFQIGVDGNLWCRRCAICLTYETPG